MAAALHHVENGFYVMVAVALAFAGAALFANALYGFAVGVGHDPLKADILEVLDGLLLVFIVSELLHTVRTVIDEKTLRPEPFLIVGIVAVIRRLIVISAEAADFVGDPRFTDLMIEMGVLVGAALGLGVTIFLLRFGRSEPLAPE
ncbi:MAG: phosphate-starvation-inducible PsiE family protein [Euzebyales bacterium]|nr:phosphate-starvation-inducible PsiE family protein [Euzebyales bacterium]